MVINNSENFPPGTNLKLVDISQPATKQSPTQKKNLREGLKAIYYEYCSNTSVHGIQYLGQNRPRKEIFFWLCIFVLSIFYCSQIIAKVYQKWNDTPVIVSFSEHSTPVSDIPFPAITICPEIRRRAPKDGKLNNRSLSLRILLIILSSLGNRTKLQFAVEKFNTGFGNFAKSHQ